MIRALASSILKSIAALAGAAWIAAGAAHATPVLGNLQQPAVDGTEAVTFNQWQASAIRLAPGAGAWRVDSLTVRITPRAANSSFSFRIVSESAFRPDLSAVKVKFTTPAMEGTGTRNVVFPAMPTPPPVLQPGQTYWLVGGITAVDENVTPGTGLYHWSYSRTSLADGSPQPGWSFDPRIATAGTGGLAWTPAVDTPFSFLIEASPDTTPMTLARWRELHPGGVADPAVYLATDYDRNGLSGLLDFAFDANPENLPVISRDPATGKRVMEYVRWADAPELTWQIESSPDLTGWVPLTGLTFTATEVGPLSRRIRAILPETSGNQFYRLTVKQN